MIETNYIFSPLNYIGGKKKLLNQIIKLFPNKISTFVDLFCGGCNVGINIVSDRVIFNDNLIYLIEMYKAFQLYKPDDIIEIVEKRIHQLDLSLTNLAGYLQLRREYNQKRNPLDLFILIAYAFNHQIRFNASHKFNTPFGKDRSSYNSNMRNNLIKFLYKIHSMNISFIEKDFRLFDYDNLNINDFVYADPPYLISRGTYNDGKRGFSGWSDKEELDLLNILDFLNEKGVKFGLSNMIEHKGRSNIILKNWIDKNNYTVHHLSINYKNSNYRTLNCDKGQTKEVLVTNF